MKYLAPLLAVVALAACSKKDEAKSSTAAPAATTTEPAAAKPAPPTPPPQANPDADYIHVKGNHTTPKPSDPDVFDIPKFKIVKAAFDPAKVEGGTADLELDLTSLSSNSARRTSDISGADYLDVAKFATITIHVDNVKKTGDNAYSADATVGAHGVTKKLPVAFTVAATTADSIRIKASQVFKRYDFGIGAPEGKEDSVAGDITIEMQLTLKKT